MAKELGSALTFAHERGVLHRDVKPENIILSVTGTKLTDFGIARIPDSTLTHAGGLLGTPAYSGPETFREGRFSPESDQFSLAATLYEAIRGERAFPGEDAVSVASKIASDSPAAFAEDMRYPPELDAILAKGMAKAPAARFESCRALGIAVMDALLRQAPAARATATPHEASGDRPSETTTSLALARLSSLPNPPPAPLHERKPLQVLLGGILTILIAGLLVRAMLKKSTTEAAEVPTAAITARVTSAEPTAKPRPRIPVAPQRPRPVLTASTSEPVPSSSADPSPPSSAAPTLPASSVVPVPTPPPP
jgi:serine/threonine-protein kinase